MDASNTGMWLSIISGIGAIIVAVIGFLGTRKGTLANAEKDFRAAIMEENRSLKSEVARVNKELLKSQHEILELKAVLIKAGLAVDKGEKADEEEGEKEE